MGWENDVLRVKVTSPPVDGRANKALVDILARSLKITKKNIAIVSGRTSRLKTIQISGLSVEEITLLTKK